jgi:hypothetical protein
MTLCDNIHIGIKAIIQKTDANQDDIIQTSNIQWNLDWSTTFQTSHQGMYVVIRHHVILSAIMHVSI